MPDGEFSLDFVERVRAGLVDGWRAQNSAQGESIVDVRGRQAWMLHSELPSQPGHVVATEQPATR